MGNKKDERATVHIPKKQNDALKKIYKRSGITITWQVQSAISFWLEAVKKGCVPLKIPQYVNLKKGKK